MELQTILVDRHWNYQRRQRLRLNPDATARFDLGDRLQGHRDFGARRWQAKDDGLLPKK
jgi:hypothetical protein